MATTREKEGVEDLVRALDGLGLVASETRTAPTEGRGRTERRGRGFDAVLRIGNRRLPVEVERDVRDADVQGLIDRLPAHSLVVADRFSPRARALLEQSRIGWFDRRGHLRLTLPPGIFIDRDVDPVIVATRGRAANPFTTVGLGVAIALLLDPVGSPGVREISRRTATSVGRVSQLVNELRNLGLVNRNGTPAIPELFEAVVGAWDPHWVALGETPPVDPGLHLAGVRAAIWHGVPLAVTEGWPPELYVRDEFALRRLVRTYQPDLEQKISPGTKVAVCPSPYGFEQATESDFGYPIVNHVVVALELAQDQGRGREALKQWNPDGVVRVW